MSDKYYVDFQGKTAGPFSLDHIAKLYQAGTLSDHSIYCTPESVEWFKIELLKPLFPGAAPPPPPIFSGAPPDVVKLIVDKRDWFCQNCMTVGRPRQIVGSLAKAGSALFVIGLVIGLFSIPLLALLGIGILTGGLAVFMVILGIVFSAAGGGKKNCCRTCNSFSIVPVTSPVADPFVSIRPEAGSVVLSLIRKWRHKKEAN